MAIDRPETNAGAPPLGAGQHRRYFLVPRGMAALPSGEESCDDAVALKRSKRIALFFGQIRPLKRSFGAVETRGLNGDVATLRLHHDDQTGNTSLFVTPPSQAMRISLSGLLHWHCPQPGCGQSANAGADRSALLWASSVPQADPMPGRYPPPFSWRRWKMIRIPFWSPSTDRMARRA